MTRYEFLKSLGFTGAALMAALTSCVREEDTTVVAPRIDATGTTAATTPTTPTPATPVVIPATGVTDISKITSSLLKIDLATSALKNVGGYIIQSNIVVARVSASAFAAVTNLCSHEPKRQVYYSQGEFYCSAHGARFNLAGKGLNAAGSRGIQAYQVATDGTTVVVY
ncbi:MAG: Rieske 2Fe-2S domain-containing protein [Bacteroidota bacterium]|jgi:nitrite reductase/ring-hydroxylating ferredoxin subunit